LDDITAEISKPSLDSKVEIIIEPKFGALFDHPKFKPFYDKAIFFDDADTSGVECSDDSLMSKPSFRFIIMNNMFWSDAFKTFLTDIKFMGKIVDIEDAEELEPYLAFEIKNGILKMYHYPKNIKDSAALISQFPLYLFTSIPIPLLKFFAVDNREIYFELRELYNAENDAIQIRNNFDEAKKICERELEKCGFKLLSEGYTDVGQDMDGDFDIYDSNDGYTSFEDDFLIIKYKDLSV
jgi:hypothetical protein